MQFVLFLALVVLVITGFYAKKSSISSKAKVGIFIFLRSCLSLRGSMRQKHVTKAKKIAP